LTGSLQRLAEDEGVLSFDGPLQQPLEILHRLSPRRGSPGDGIELVMLTTLTLIKNLRLLPPEQRAVTSLRSVGPADPS
jgi:hypothetical protein